MGVLSALDSEITQDVASDVVSFIMYSKLNQVRTEEKETNAPRTGIDS